MNIVLDLTQLADMIAERLAERQPAGPEVMTTRQAAEFLQLAENTVLQMAAQRELPGRKLGKEWRFVRSELLHHLSVSDNAAD